MNFTEIKGSKNNAIIYNPDVDETSLEQIKALIENEAFHNSKIRIMPDVHAGTGSVIGFTATIPENKVSPNIVGVDIACGVKTVCLGKNHVDKECLKSLDVFIREHIPCGFAIHQTPVQEIIDFPFNNLLGLKQVAEKTGQDFEYVARSIGTLGGGNHFLELGIDDEECYWLTVHTGSRNFGLKIAAFYQKIAKEKHPEMGNLAFVEGDDFADYMNAMVYATKFSEISRDIILRKVTNGFFNLDYDNLEKIESIHNYIDIDDRIIRKGAVSARKGEKVVIPWNMKDGLIIGRGIGNEDWNNSAPHGAGRKLARKKALNTLELSEFEKEMSDVWSSCINEKTLDESPMAYKNYSDIKELIDGVTITIDKNVKPLYNFKGI